MPEPLALKDQTSEAQIYIDRVSFCFGLLVLGALLLVGRMFYLQIVEHDRYSTLADENRIQVQSIAPVRGLIYDRNGVLIADNVPSKFLTLTTELTRDVTGTLDALRDVIGLNDAEIEAFAKRRARKRRPYDPVPVRYHLSEEEIARIEVNRYRLPGVRVDAQLVRHYPERGLLAHAVGSVRRINEDDLKRIDQVAYSGTDHIGKTGIERFYEPLLLGRVGYRRIETNALGRVMNVLDETKPVPGRNLTLQIDAGLQQAASDALGDRRGVVVAIEPATGGILAMVSKPSYDPNLFVTGIDHETYGALRDSIDVPLFNRVLQGQYEPGSTLKPFLGLIGLAEGTVTEETIVEDPGWFRLRGNQRLYRDWNWTKDGRGGHGDAVNLDRALYRSCNVYFYSLAVKMGIGTIHENLALFGFGRNLSLDLPEGRSGLLLSPDWKRTVRGEQWYPGDTVNIGIGQGDMLVTPLQLASAVTVIANRGRFIPPRLLLEGADVPEAREQVDNVTSISREHWDAVILGMENVIHRGNMGFGENGTAWAYIGQDIPYRMAGKSGTAQVVGIKQGEEYDEELLDDRQRKHAWFVAFAPVEAPTIALAVLVENGGGGSSVASPVARTVLDHYLLDDTPGIVGR
ncbi:MAG: penicillin-binding protein 2 [Gammaproteobacteria bacterium]|nr:penicillin-binding protein 2 [Gammaproteobacteria bacterium]